MRHGRISTLVVMLLTFVTVFCGNAGIPGALADSAGKVEYIADVQAFQGGTITECKQLCEQMGFKPTNININEGAKEKVPVIADDPAPCVMLGYKTTNDRSRSLTGIAVLHMGEGYEMRDFQSVAASLLARNKNLAESMAAAAVEFRTNYDWGAPAAVMAFKVLDLLYVDPISKHSFAGYTDGKKYKNDSMMDASDCKRMLDKSDPTKVRPYDAYDTNEHQSLAYYILEGNADAEFFAKLITYGTPSIVGAVYNALVSGSAEYNNYVNPETGERETMVWAARVRDGDAKRMIAEGLTTDQWRKFDRAYMDAARDLVAPVQDFATLYLNAKSRGSKSDDFLNQEGVEDLDDLPTWGRSLKDEDLDWTYMAAFEILNRYQYDEGKPLGNWIVEMGQRTYSSDEDYRRLYPLVDAISPMQVTLLKYCGLSTFVSSMCQPDQDLPYSNETFGLIEAKLKEQTEGTGEWRVCVWDGVDNSVYGGTVGLTSDVIRVSGANSVLQMNDSEKRVEYKRYLGWYWGLGTGFITLLQMGLKFFHGVKMARVAAAAAEVGGAAMSKFWAGWWLGVGSAGELLGTITFWLWVAEIVITVAIFVGIYLYKEFKKPQSDYTAIPTLMFDTKTTKTGPIVVKYDAVWEPLRARVADANAYVGSKWNCLYVTRDTRAGTPLVVSEGKDPFVLRAGDPKEPSGYATAALFGQQGAANLNDGAYKVVDDRQNYLFYTTEGSLRAASGLNEGEESANKDGLYIADVVVASADSVERARAKIVGKKGKYYLLDRNLGTEEKPVYLGYSLTAIEKDAVKDIRVFASSSDGELAFGQARYSLSGNLANGDGLYISRSEIAGTPIKPNLKLVNNLKDVPEGFEPVVYASGAPVYMFGLPESPYAMYFEPKVKYTEGDTYVAGIGFITTDKMSGDVGRTESIGQDGYNGVDMDKGYEMQKRVGAIDDVLKQANWQDCVLASDMSRYRESHAEGRPSVKDKDSDDLSFAINMANGLSYGVKTTEHVGGDPRMVNENYVQIDMGMYMVVAFTHNPYRAIRDVGTYTATTKNTTQIPASLSKVLTWKKNDVEKTAGAAYVACEAVTSAVARGLHKTDRTTLGQHAYLSQNTREGLNGMCVPAKEDGSKVSWKRSHLRLGGLYVLGPVEGIDPLKPSDVVVSTKGYELSDSDGDIGCELPDGTYAVDGTSAAGAAFRSVQDLRFPYNLVSQNLSYPAFEGDEGEA